MEGDSAKCRFYWCVDNPFLPVQTKEVTFCFTSPILAKWNATLQRGQVWREGEWSVFFSLQYLPPDGGGDEGDLIAYVTVNFVRIGNYTPRRERVVFDGKKKHTLESKIIPEHGKLEIEVEIVIIDQGDDIFLRKIALDPLMDLSEDLRRLLSDQRYFDMRIQSRDPSTSFPVHSYILDARWWRFFRELAVQSNPAQPPTVDANIRPEVLNYILTYLYTGSASHLHLVNLEFEKYIIELFRTMDRYPLHHLYFILRPEPRSQNRDTKTHISSTAMTFRLRDPGRLGPYIWTHSPLEDVFVTTILRFYLETDGVPSVSYQLRFINPVKLATRVSLVYARKVVKLASTMETVVYEKEREVLSNGEVRTAMPVKGNLTHLREFLAGEDRKEGRYEVEHSFRFVLHLSDGGKCIKVFKMNDYSGEKLASLRMLGKHVSLMRRRTIGLDLKVDSLGENLEPYHLHKGMFAVRIPNWRNVIEDAPEGDTIPDSVKCTVSSHALQFVIEYLYTATCSPTPRGLNAEIKDFARRAGFSALETDIYEIQFAPYVTLMTGKHTDFA